VPKAERLGGLPARQVHGNDTSGALVGRGPHLCRASVRPRNLAHDEQTEADAARLAVNVRAPRHRLEQHVLRVGSDRHTALCTATENDVAATVEVTVIGACGSP
jgi:hypothetical protein